MTIKLKKERSDTMKKKRIIIQAILLVLVAFGVSPVWAHVFFQCPCLDDPTAANVVKANGNIECNVGTRNIACKHITAGDGLRSGRPFGGRAQRDVYFRFSRCDLSLSAERRVCHESRGR